MLFLEAQKRLSSEVTKNSGDADTQTKIKNALNFGKSEVSKYSHWRHLEVPNNELLILPQYTTGTATVVQGSRTVSLGGGGTVIVGFKGRLFKGQGSAQPYEIADVDTVANTLTLKSPIIEVSQTYTYSIWKKFYRVPSDIRLVLPNEDYSDLPTPLEIHGYDDYAVDYSVVVTLTAGSNICIGSGFIDAVFPGDMVKTDVNVYRVRIVQSDTKIILVNNAISSFMAVATFSADTPYKAKIVGMANPFFNGLGLLSNPSGNSILPFSYIRTLYDMVADDDDTELPVYFDRSILDHAKAEYGRATNSTTWANDLNLAQARLQKLELNRDLLWQSHRQFNPLIKTGNGRGRAPGGSY